MAQYCMLQKLWHKHLKQMPIQKKGGLTGSGWHYPQPLWVPLPRRDSGFTPACRPPHTFVQTAPTNTRTWVTPILEWKQHLQVGSEQTSSPWGLWQAGLGGNVGTRGGAWGGGKKRCPILLPLPHWGGGVSVSQVLASHLLPGWVPSIG